MFETAFKELGLHEEDKPRVIMIGNNLKRDIVGANRFGITSVWMSWSKRYSQAPACPEEEPDYTIPEPAMLLPLVEKLESELEKRS